MLSLAHSGGWTGECERRGAGMCPAWRQVHLTRPASCTPARALQHSSQSLSKCAGATSTTISSAKSRFHNMRQVSPFVYACLPQKYEAQNRRTALASPHSHATCQPHRCQVRFCLGKRRACRTVICLLLARHLPWGWNGPVARGIAHEVGACGSSIGLGMRLAI